MVTKDNKLEREKKEYKLFMNTLIKSGIIVDRPLLNYTTMLKIENDFEEKRYFQTMMRLSCLIESILYELLLLKLAESPKKILVEEFRKMQEIPLGTLIDWVSGKPITKNQVKIAITNWDTPIINEEEQKKLHYLREVRNDIAHISFLTYDENLKSEIIEKIIDDVRPIHHKLIDEIIKITEQKLEREKEAENTLKSAD